jgi:hypothetical protein
MGLPEESPPPTLADQGTDQAWPARLDGPTRLSLLMERSACTVTNRRTLRRWAMVPRARPPVMQQLARRIQRRCSAVDREPLLSDSSARKTCHDDLARKPCHDDSARKTCHDDSARKTCHSPRPRSLRNLGCVEARMCGACGPARPQTMTWSMSCTHAIQHATRAAHIRTRTRSPEQHMNA